MVGQYYSYGDCAEVIHIVLKMIFWLQRLLDIIIALFFFMIKYYNVLHNLATILMLAYYRIV